MLKFSKKKNDLSRFAKPRDACTVWSKNWKHENHLKSLWKPSWSLVDFSWFYFFHTTDRSQKWNEISIRNVKKTEVEFFRILKWKLVIFGKCRWAENKKILDCPAGAWPASACPTLHEPPQSKTPESSKIVVSPLSTWWETIKWAFPIGRMSPNLLNL